MIGDELKLTQASWQDSSSLRARYHWAQPLVHCKKKKGEKWLRKPGRTYQNRISVNLAAFKYIFVSLKHPLRKNSRS